jgi:hypothetical protein
MRSSHSNHGVLGEYHAVAETMFPPEGFTPERQPDLKAVRDFAKALGIDAEYERLFALDSNDAKMREFLGHFRNNLDLLIQKTWVEKFDEERKGKLQDEIPPFMELIEQGNFQRALEEFGKILEELSYLFFGLQSTKEDFTEYTFRIDLQMGLFWWYGCRLGILKKDGVCDDFFFRAVLLLGLCSLTNF